MLPLLEGRGLFWGIAVRRLRAPVNGHACRLMPCSEQTGGVELAKNAAGELLRQTPG